MQKATGRVPEEIAQQPDLPHELVYLWDWYLEMRTGEPLTFTEMYHWAKLTQTELGTWEVDLLRSIDRLFWKVAAHDGKS